MLLVLNGFYGVKMCQSESEMSTVLSSNYSWRSNLRDNIAIAFCCLFRGEKKKSLQSKYEISK